LPAIPFFSPKIIQLTIILAENNYFNKATISKNEVLENPNPNPILHLKVLPQARFREKTGCWGKLCPVVIVYRKD
jgi:hypothetical protein